MNSNRWMGALLLAALVSPSQAERKPLAFGLLGGMNLATLWGHDVEPFNDVRFWPVAGGSMTFHLPQFLGLETDLLYASRGSTFSSHGWDSVNQVPNDHITTFTEHTLTLPVMLKVTAPIGTEVQPIFFGGPAWAYLFSKANSSEFVTTDAAGNVQTIATTPLIAAGSMRTVEFLLVIGGGLEWGLGTIQGRLNFGQQSLDKTNKVEVKTLTFDLLAGFTF